MSCCSTCDTHACACGCGEMTGTPLPLHNRPGLTRLDYRVGTWADFRATMQRDLGNDKLPALAGLRTRETDDPAMALLDTWAVGADVLSFYTERIANEGYLRTATERRSILELARLTDYRLRPGVAASVYLAYDVEKDSPPVTIPAGAQAKSIPAPGEEMQTFETAEPLEARYEWNALRPRQALPQPITRGSLDTLGELAFKGTTNNLGTNDWLVFEFDDGNDPEVRQIKDAHVDMERDITRVSLHGSVPVTATVGPAGGATMAMSSAVVTGLSDAAPAGGFTGLVDALRESPTLQPANAARLSRSVAVALGTASDARPQLLLNFVPTLAETFYVAWSDRAVPESSAQVSNIYVQRLAAARFGYNAPWPTVLVEDGTETHSERTSTDLQSEERDGTLFLDNAYEGIRPGSYVIVTTPATTGETATVDVHKVGTVAIHPRTAYGISGKTTELGLEAEATSNGPAEDVPAVEMASVIQRITDTVRVQQVFAQSEKLEQAELPLTDEIGAIPAVRQAKRVTEDDATRLGLDTAVDGLEPGRWLIVEGQRSDIPGTDAVSAAELVMLAAVEQGVDATLPGDTVHSTLVFANQGLAYRYHRDSVTIHANVVRSTHGETRHEVLGSGNGALSMQAFVLKQSPLTYVSAATPSGVRSTLGVRVNDLQWHETRNLAFVGAADRNFVTAIDNDGKTSVQFGDGAHGARLPTGVENVVATYRNGIGAPGNVDARQISLLATRPVGVKSVVNPLRASGGADAETRDQARRNVPLAVLALDRLVSVPDYEDFARTFGGVGKAAAIKLGHLVQVTIAGADDAPVDATSDLYRNLLEAMQRYGDPSLPVYLGVRELLALKLSAKVGLAPDYAWESVEPELRAALLDEFGFERRALARNVYLSEVVACMQAVRGVAWVDVDAFGWFDEATLLCDFDTGAGNGNDGEGDPEFALAGISVAEATTATPATPGTFVPVLPAGLGDDGRPYPAQLAYLLPDVPDTLLLQEATS